MTQNKLIKAYALTSGKIDVTCTVPNTYLEKMDRQTSHPSCGFYAASYVLNCFNPDVKWTNESLFNLAQTYPLENSADSYLSEVGEVFHPEDFARFINERADGSCSASCKLFHEQIIWDTINQGGYVLVPFQVNNEGKHYGFPRTGVRNTDDPHAHWCVIAGYVTEKNSLLLSKHWGKDRLFDINALKNSNQGHYPVQQTNGISEPRALKVQLLKNMIITIRPPQATSGRRGCAC